MFQTKVIRYLKCFDQKVLTKLIQFLESPFFFHGRKIDEVLILLKYLLRYQPTYEHPKLRKEIVYRKIYPEQAFNERRFQHLMTKTNRAIEEFITHYYRPELFGYPPDALSHMAFFRKQNLPRQFEKIYQKAMARQSAQAVKDSAFYWHNYLLTKERANQDSIFNVRQGNLHLPQTLNQLDHFYLIEKLSSACIFLNQSKHQLPLDAKASLESLEALLPLLHKGHFRDIPLLNLLYYTYLLLQNHSTDEEYQTLKSAYDQYAMQIGLSHRQIIHGAMRNFCAQQLNSGKGEYLQESFLLYTEGLQQGVLDSGGGLLSATFKNMVNLGVKLQQYDWVEQILKTYRHRIIGTEDPEQIYSLNRAQLLFARDLYDDALDCLRYDFADLYMKLTAKRLEIQIYYELDSPLLFAKLQAFKVFVFRIPASRITPRHREGYSNFIDLLKQILHSSTLNNEARRRRLEEKIKKKGVVGARDWLLEKVRQ